MSAEKLPVPYKFSILIGLGVGVLFALKSYLMFWYWNESNQYMFRRHALVPIVNYTLWGLLMPLAYFFIRRYQIGRESPLPENLLAIGAALLMSVLHEGISNVIYYLPLHLLNVEPFTPKILAFIIRAYPSAVINRLIEYWILYAVVRGLAYQRKYRDKQLELARLEGQLSNARLSALRLQLQPHFLFNTLNAISSLMDIDVKNAQRIVSRLGNLLRRVLDSDQHNVVALRDELAYITDYLEIEQTRFVDRLDVDLDIDERALNAPVPALILQPLVEHAVKHGFEKHTGPVRIDVRVRRQDDGRLWLRVQHEGPGNIPPLEQLVNAGGGLKNIVDRLDLLYKNEYFLTVDSPAGQGFSITLVLPAQPVRP